MGEYSAILDFATEIAVKAGKFVREARKTGLHIDAKSAIDFVSDKDRMSEDLIRNAIHEHFPDHLFFGEESVYGATAEEETAQITQFREDDYIWVVDPIDGTVNYIRDYPMYAISIAVVHNKEIVVGVVYDVFRKEVFSAEKGCGAFLNGSKIHVSEAGSPTEAIITTSMPTFSMNLREKMVKKLTIISSKFQSMRIWNCAAVSLISVACGRSDAHYEAGIHIWDMAASVLIITEAGGIVSQINGEPYILTSTDVLATNGIIHQETVALLKSKNT